MKITFISNASDVNIDKCNVVQNLVGFAGKDCNNQCLGVTILKMLLSFYD